MSKVGEKRSFSNMAGVISESSSDAMSDLEDPDVQEIIPEETKQID